MSIGESLIFWHGKASDTKFVWFPFLFFKPKTAAEKITVKKTILMAPLFGLYMALPWSVFYLVTGKYEFNDVIESIVKFSGFFLVWFNVVTRPLWNARAKRAT